MTKHLYKALVTDSEGSFAFRKWNTTEDKAREHFARLTRSEWYGDKLELIDPTGRILASA